MLKTSMNLQDTFLNNMRKEKISVKINLVNGNSLFGVIQGFDSFAIFLKHKTQELIYKHAIATIVPVQAISQISDKGKTERGFKTKPRIKVLQGRRGEKKESLQKNSEVKEVKEEDSTEKKDR